MAPKTFKEEIVNTLIDNHNQKGRRTMIRPGLSTKTAISLISLCFLGIIGLWLFVIIFVKYADGPQSGFSIIMGIVIATSLGLIIVIRYIIISHWKRPTVDWRVDDPKTYKKLPDQKQGDAL